ncbi:MAG: type II secretion system protein [Candidatus Sericytochromatia bacterium]|nr:type II secretion system protein [Candidatus Sericytochromatia bacterium]
MSKQSTLGTATTLNTHQRGFTLLEVGVSMAIMGLMMAMILPLSGSYMRDSVLKRYAAEMEYFLKHARMVGMEKSQNIGFCQRTVGNEIHLEMRLLGSSNTSDTCNNGTVFKTFRLPISENMDLNSNDLTGYYDPRGKFVYTGENDAASACLTNRTGFHMFRLQPYGLLQRREGNGNCPA